MKKKDTYSLFFFFYIDKIIFNDYLCSNLIKGKENEQKKKQSMIGNKNIDYTDTNDVPIFDIDFSYGCIIDLGGMM